MHSRGSPYGQVGRAAARLREAVHQRLLAHHANDELLAGRRADVLKAAPARN